MFGKNQEIAAIIDEANSKRQKLQQTADIAFQDAALEVFQGQHENTETLHGLFNAVEAMVVPTLKNIEAEQSRDRQQRGAAELKKAVEEQIQ